MDRESCDECGNELPVFWRYSETIIGDGSAKFLCDGCWKKRSDFAEAHGMPMPHTKPEPCPAFERNDHIRENRNKYFQLLNIQVELLLQKGYHKVLRRNMDEFIVLFKVLTRKLFLEDDLPDFDEVIKRGEVPLVVVFPFPFLSFDAQIELAGISELPSRFSLIRERRDQTFGPYLAIGISKRRGTKELPLRAEEGFAVLSSSFSKQITKSDWMIFPGSRPETQPTSSCFYIAISEESGSPELLESLFSEGVVGGYCSCSRRIST